MSPVLKAVLMVIPLAAAPAGYVFYNAVLSPDNFLYARGKASDWSGLINRFNTYFTHRRDLIEHRFEKVVDRRVDTGYHGAPAPVAGASLPVLAVGFGVYWLVRRR